jgi:hypothetical protein
MFGSDNSKRYPRSLQLVIWLVLPVWVVLAVELIGGWRFGKDTYSSRYAISLRGQYWTVVYATVGAVLISPLLAISALIVTRNHRAEYRSRTRLYWGVLLLVTLSLLVSMFSCAWSCGGHPTWTSGYR